MQRFTKNIFFFSVLLILGLALPVEADRLREVTSQKNVYVTDWSKLKHRAELGDPEALFVLGNYYFSPPKGSGFRRNYKKAAEYYFQASIRDYPAAQYNVALMLHQGLGFEKNPLESYAWFYLASINASPVAKPINAKTSPIVSQLQDEMAEPLMEEANQKIANYQAIMNSKRYRDAQLPKLKGDEES